MNGFAIPLKSEHKQFLQVRSGDCYICLAKLDSAPERTRFRPARILFAQRSLLPLSLSLSLSLSPLSLSLSASLPSRDLRSGMPAAEVQGCDCRRGRTKRARWSAPPRPRRSQPRRGLRPHAHESVPRSSSRRQKFPPALGCRLEGRGRRTTGVAAREDVAQLRAAREEYVLAHLSANGAERNWTAVR
eukprot:SAG11_NODE_9921_length_870_cov_0.705577_2_plen_188_part_00